MSDLIDQSLPGFGAIDSTNAAEALGNAAESAVPVASDCEPEVLAPVVAFRPSAKRRGIAAPPVIDARQGARQDARPDARQDARKDTRKADSALRPAPAAPAEHVPAKRDVPVAIAKTGPDAVARAHGRRERHRIRRPGAIGGVVVRAPLLDPTRSAPAAPSGPPAKPSRVVAHPKVVQRRQSVHRAEQFDRVRPFVWPLVVASILSLALLVIFVSPLFTVRRIDQRVTGSPAQQAEVSALTNRLLGQNLVRSNAGHTVSAIRAFPWVASVDVERHFPRAVEVVVVAHQLAGAVKTPDGRFAVAAADATVISIVNDGDPMIVGIPRIDLALTTTPVPGDVLESPAADVLKGSASVMAQLPGRLASVRVRNGEVSWALRPTSGTKDIRVVVGPASSGEIAAAALASVLSRPGGAAVAIDLRTPDTPILDIPSGK